MTVHSMLNFRTDAMTVGVKMKGSDALVFFIPIDIAVENGTLPCYIRKQKLTKGG